VCFLQSTLFAGSSALQKILDDFKYVNQTDISFRDQEVVKLDPFPVIGERFDDKKFRLLDSSLHHRHKLTQFEKTQEVNMFGTSFVIDDAQAYDPTENHGGNYEMPLVSNLRSIDKRIKGGIILSENATLYLRTGVRWKIPGLPDNVQLWLPYRRKSTVGFGLRIEEKRP
jgi:hypothetical protein